MGLFKCEHASLVRRRKKAFHRLQKEILKQTKDVSLFVWQADNSICAEPSDLLASSPTGFQSCGNIVRLPSPVCLPLPTKGITTSISVSDGAVRLRGTTLEPLDDLMAQNCCLYEDEEVNNTFLHNWQHSWLLLKQRSNAVTLVLDCGTLEAHSAIVLDALYDVNGEKVYGRVRPAVVPWVLTDGNFNRHVEIRGVKAVVKGHKDPFGYCLDYLDNSVRFRLKEHKHMEHDLRMARN